MRAIAALAALATLCVAAGCLDSAAPVIGRPYLLRTVNGAPLPWRTPPSDSSYTGATIDEGWVTLLDATRAERHERVGRWVPTGGSDSTWIGTEFTEGATYQRHVGTIVLTYFNSAFEWFIPPQAVETLYVRPHGALELRITGLLPPLDSLVKVYCTTDC